MTTPSLSCIPTVDQSQTRRVMTTLETLTDSLHRSIENPDLHKILIGVLLQQITPIVHDLQSAYEMNSELTSEIKYLRETNGKVTREANYLLEERNNSEATQDRIQDDIRWFRRRFDEFQNTEKELLMANKHLETELSDVLLREEHLLECVQELRLSIGEFIEKMAGRRVSRFEMESFFGKNFLGWIDPSTRDLTDDEQDQPMLQESNLLSVPEKPCRGSGREVNDIGFVVDMGDPGNDQSRHFAQTANSNAHANKVAKIAEESVKEPSDTSVFTDAIRTRMSGSKTSKSAITRDEEIQNKSQHMQPSNKKLVPEANSSLRAQTDTASKPVFINTSAGYIGTDISPASVSGNLKEDIEKESFPVKHHTKQCPENHPMKHLESSPQVYHSSHYSETANCTKDHIKYADITGEGMWDTDSDVDSINPEICVPDPNEIAGAWNDVPAPLELLNKKNSEAKCIKAISDCPRAVKLLRLPSKITTAMISKFVRGGKITSLVIINGKAKNSVRQALVTFLLPSAARDFHNWVQEFPGSLMVDGLRCPSSIQMAVQPPLYGEEVRVLDLACLPKGIDSAAKLQEFVKVTTLEKARRQVPIEQTTFTSVDESKYDSEISGRVVFDTIEDAILMKRVWERRWGVKVQWGHDGCEGPLLDMDPREKVFWFNELDQSPHGSD